MIDTSVILPPQNIRAEEGVIASVLLFPSCIDELMGFLRPEDFYRDSHQILFRTLCLMRDSGKEIDSITLEEALIVTGQLERVGGLDAILDIQASEPDAMSSRYYAQIVHEKAVARDLIEASNETVRDCYSNNFDAAELMTLAESRVYAVADNRSSEDHSILAQEALAESTARLDRTSDGNASGITTGFSDLDSMLSTMRAQSLTIVASRPSMGKSAFALDVALHAARFHRVPVLLASLEMGRGEIGDRMLSSMAKVDGRKLRHSQILSAHDRFRITEAVRSCEDFAPLTLFDPPSATVQQIAAKARRIRGIGLVIVDYIQLVDPSNPGESRQEQVAKISRDLKKSARQLDCPVIALSQLNRKVEERTDRRPMMSDLRESGAIEQDADHVILLHRPEYYDANDQPGIAELILAKNRSGETGSVKLVFVKHLAKFESLSVASVPDEHLAF